MFYITSNKKKNNEKTPSLVTNGHFVLNNYLMFQTNKFGFQNNIIIFRSLNLNPAIQFISSPLIYEKEVISLSGSCMKHLYLGSEP